MKPADYVILIFIGVCFILALIYTIKKKGCGSDSSSCSGCDSCKNCTLCHKNDDKTA